MGKKRSYGGSEDSPDACFGAPGAGAGAGAGAGVGVGAGAAAGAATAGAPSPGMIMNSSWFRVTVSPSSIRTAVNVPDVGALICERRLCLG